MRIVRLSGAEDRPWIVNLYDEREELICVCGPYSAAERDLCVGLFLGQWVVVAAARPREQEPQQVHDLITRPITARLNPAEIRPPTPLLACPTVSPPVTAAPPLVGRARRWWRKRELREREASRWAVPHGTDRTPAH